jgi:hypothetical protein
MFCFPENIVRCHIFHRQTENGTLCFKFDFSIWLITYLVFYVFVCCGAFTFEFFLFEAVNSHQLTQSKKELEITKTEEYTEFWNSSANGPVDTSILNLYFKPKFKINLAVQREVFFVWIEHWEMKTNTSRGGVRCFPSRLQIPFVSKWFLTISKTMWTGTQR